MYVLFQTVRLDRNWTSRFKILQQQYNGVAYIWIVGRSVPKAASCSMDVDYDSLKKGPVSAGSPVVAGKKKQATSMRKRGYLILS